MMTATSVLLLLLLGCIHAAAAAAAAAAPSATPDAVALCGSGSSPSDTASAVDTSSPPISPGVVACSYNGVVHEALEMFVDVSPEDAEYDLRFWLETLVGRAVDV